MRTEIVFEQLDVDYDTVTLAAVLAVSGIFGQCESMGECDETSDFEAMAVRCEIELQRRCGWGLYCEPQ